MAFQVSASRSARKALQPAGSVQRVEGSRKLPPIFRAQQLSGAMHSSAFSQWNSAYSHAMPSQRMHASNVTRVAVRYYFTSKSKVL